MKKFILFLVAVFATTVLFSSAASARVHEKPLFDSYRKDATVEAVYMTPLAPSLCEKMNNDYVVLTVIFKKHHKAQYSLAAALLTLDQLDGIFNDTLGKGSALLPFVPGISFDYESETPNNDILYKRIILALLYHHRHSLPAKDAILPVEPCVSQCCTLPYAHDAFLSLQVTRITDNNFFMVLDSPKPDEHQHANQWSFNEVKANKSYNAIGFTRRYFDLFFKNYEEPDRLDICKLQDKLQNVPENQDTTKE